MTTSQALLTLNLKNNPSEKDIKKAYRKLSNIYHPDKVTGNLSKFLNIKDAYDVLITSFKEKYYSTAFTLHSIVRLKNKSIRLTISTTNIKSLIIYKINGIQFIYEISNQINEENTFSITLNKKELKQLNYELHIRLIDIKGKTIFNRYYKLKKPNFFNKWF